MRVISGICAALFILVGMPGHASDRVDLVKVKTGILPNGGFYSLYEAECPIQGTAAVASLNGKRRWCSLQDGAMSCSSSQQKAALNACKSSTLAAADRGLDATDGYN